ncbi:helix-turn-helix domain-containing protein [Nocardiopsis sp. CNT-189]|uniref:helix-turn-helix domain-containing protein n=1 Tax=Nocardiopsis oceanisediminis TaxID=2816862 RepID=UPI003B293558
MAKEKIELGPTGRTVAENLRRLRITRELSLRELAELADQAGRKFGVNALSQAEKGLRRLDVDDLVVLAVVLNVNPSALMLPVEVDRERPVEITGHGEVPAIRAWKWVDGHMPLPGRASEQQARAFDQAVRPWWSRANTLTVSDINAGRLQRRPLEYDDQDQEDGGR